MFVVRQLTERLGQDPFELYMRERREKEQEEKAAALSEGRDEQGVPEKKYKWGDAWPDRGRSRSRSRSRSHSRSRSDDDEAWRRAQRERAKLPPGHPAIDTDDEEEEGELAA